MMYQNSLKSGLQAKEIDLFVFYRALFEIKTLVVHIFQVFFFSTLFFSVRSGKVIFQRGQRGGHMAVVNRLTTKGRRAHKTLVIVAHKTAKSV